MTSKISTVVLIIISVGMLTVSRSSAAENQPEHKDVEYHISTSLIFVDSLFDKRPTTTPTNSETFTKSFRTLGLKDARAQFLWSVIPQSQLSWTIRPDALIKRDNAQNSITREFDSRAGSTYQQKPQISLLDSYYINTNIHEALSLQAGVFDDIAPSFQSYPEILEFGLNAQLPQKYSAFGLSIAQRISDNSLDIYNRRLKAGIYVLHGNYERAEIYGQNSLQQDSAPSTTDPYLGAMVYVDWDISNYVELLAHAGLNTSKIEPAGRHHDVFLHGGVTYRRDNISFPYKIALDGKWIRENYKFPETSRPLLIQQSIALTSSFQFMTNTSVLGGLHYGKQNQFAPLDPTRRSTSTGMQWDLGLQHQAHKALRIAVLANMERRTISDPTVGQQGAFKVGEENRKSIRRIAAEINYAL